MPFEQFPAYVHERSLLLKKGDLSPELRKALGRAIVQEDEDWLKWKVHQEMLESWLGLRQKVVA
jgi:hypothetical protein